MWIDIFSNQYNYICSNSKNDKFFENYMEFRNKRKLVELIRGSCVPNLTELYPLESTRDSVRRNCTYAIFLISISFSNYIWNFEINLKTLRGINEKKMCRKIY